MFHIGLPEIGIVVLAFILFIKPEDIPKVFRYLGQLYGYFMRLFTQVSDGFRDLSYTQDDHIETPLHSNQATHQATDQSANLTDQLSHKSSDESRQ